MRSVRVFFVTLVTAALCVLAAPSRASLGTNFSDQWWNPNESGWGLNIIQHANNIIFAIWYTYDAEGKMTWFHVPQGTWTDSMTYTGDLYAAAGPSFANPTFNAAQVKRRAVGTATLRFSGPGSGTWSYSVDGVSGTKTIERLAF